LGMPQVTIHPRPSYRAPSHALYVRLKPKLISGLLAWIDKQPEDLTLQDALRRLAAIGLSSASGTSPAADAGEDEVV
jgi:hypothetical protein